MADNTQKQIDDLQRELDQIEQSIQGIARTMQTSITLSLKSGLDNARKLTEEFNNGNNITKKLKTELDKNKSAIEATFLKQIRLQSLLSIAQRNGNVIREQSLRASINDLNIQRQILIQTDTQLRQLERISEEKRKQGSLLEAAKKYYNDNIKNQLTLLATFKLIVNAAFAYNKASVEIGKNFGYGTEQADKLASSLIKIARNSDNVNVTFKSLNEAMNELSTTTGFVAEYSKDTLETQVMLTKQLGLTGEEAAGVYKFSVLTGKSSKETYTSMKNTFVAMRNQLGVGIPFKATMAEIAKTSGQIAASLGYNPDRIAKAVIQAKALGTTLEQTKNQADFLLDFESSIEAELKAELLTGQALNLERARALALSNDLAGVAEEIANQGMTAAKYGQMNAIAQKSFAASVGLTSDQLSDQLQKRELALASGKSLAQLNQEETDEAAKRQSIQERFNVAIEKLQDLIGGLVAGPLGQFLDMITFILEKTIALEAITAVYIGRQAYLLTLKAAELLLTKKNARANAADASIEAGKSASKVPVIGAVLGVAAALASYAAFSGLLSKGDDVVSPGYGKRMIFGPEGAVSLNNKDTIVAGTNLGGGGGGEQSNSMNNNAILAKLDQIASRPSVAYIQGERPFANALGKQSQLFTSGMQNQSKFA